jgi:hypothetical protein
MHAPEGVPLHNSRHRPEQTTLYRLEPQPPLRSKSREAGHEFVA